MATKTQPKKAGKVPAVKARPKIEPTQIENASPAATESDQAGGPVCPRHQVAAEVERTDGFFAHYRCPEEGCKFTTKRALPRMQQKLERENEQRRFEAR